MLYINNSYTWNLRLVCFYILKIFIKKFKKNIFLFCFKLIFFFDVLDNLDTLILKIILKK